ncbi:MAG: YicC/YloC family endoribonuclease [Planctomycetota bacterium]
MTGHGSSVVETDNLHVLAEIRAVNNRFLKISISGDLDAPHQSQLESVIRERVQRGAVNVRIQLQFLGENSQYSINTSQLNAYRQQLTELGPIEFSPMLLSLPGVITENIDDSVKDEAWPVIEMAMNQALDAFVEMRSLEGQAMLDDMLQNCSAIEKNLGEIKELAPQVIESYSSRVTDRINRMLEEYEISVTPAELVKEIGVFTERVDISEEVVRLGCHVEQFRSVSNADQSSGRKLDFLTQELLRETNTIGSKANDAEIANRVIEIKTLIERIREMVQNVE